MLISFQILYICLTLCFIYKTRADLSWSSVARNSIYKFSKLFRFQHFDDWFHFDGRKKIKCFDCSKISLLMQYLYKYAFNILWLSSCAVYIRYKGSQKAIHTDLFLARKVNYKLLNGDIQRAIRLPCSKDLLISLDFRFLIVSYETG